MRVNHEGLPRVSPTRRSFLKVAAAAAGATALAVGPGQPVLRALAADSDAAGAGVTEVVRTVCTSNCVGQCALNITVRDGKVVKSEPADFPDNRYRRMCVKGISNIQREYSERRIKYPMKRAGERGSGKFERISWDEATTIIATNFKEVAEKYGPESVALIQMTGNLGSLSDAPKRLVNLIGGAVPESSFLMSDAGHGMGSILTTGELFVGNDYTDLVNSRLVILWGTNSVETTLGDMHFLYDAKEAGTRFIVIDPKFTPTAAFADWWIPIRPGTDAALAMGVMNVMIENDLWDRDFIAKHSIGPVLVRDDTGALLRESDVVAGGSSERFAVWDTVANAITYADDSAATPALAGSFTANGLSVKPSFQLLHDAVLEYTPEKVEEITGVPAADVVRLATEYGQAKPARVLTGQGMSRTFHSYNQSRAVMTMGAMHGDFGVPGGGAGDHYGAAGAYWLMAISAAGFAQPDPTRTSPPLKGMQLFEAIRDGNPWPVKALWVQKYNMLVQGPRPNMVEEDVLPKLDFLLVSEISMTETAKWADLILPVSMHYEETNLVGSVMNFYLHLRQKCVEPLWESKTDFQASKVIADKMGVGEYFDKSEEEYISEILANSPLPFVQTVTLDQLKEGPVRLGVPDPWIHFPDKEFSTSTKRFEFYTEGLKPLGQALPQWLPPFEGQDSAKTEQYPLSLVSGHTRLSGGSTHRQIPWIKEIDAEPVLEISSVDAASRGIESGDFVTAFNDRGTCTLKARVSEGIMPKVVYIGAGWWPDQYKGGQYADLTYFEHEPVSEAIAETNYAPYDILVEVRKEG